MSERDVKARSDRRSPGFFLLSLIMVALTQATAQPTRVRSLAFDGIESISVNQLREEFATKEGLPLSVEILKTDVRNLFERYHLEGYVFCSAESVLQYVDDSSSVDVTILVKEGNQVVMGSLQVAGGDDAQVRLPEMIPGLRRGAVFFARSIEMGIQNLLKDLEKKGYPFASVGVDRIDFTAGDEIDTANVTVLVETGERILVTEVQVEGNTNTKTSVIEREARLTGNQPFSNELAGAVKRRLDRLRLFSSVSMPELFVTGMQEGGILIRVKEGKPNRFDGILGYVPALGNQKGYVTGLIDLEFRNLFGTARSFSASWIRENQSTQALMLKYREPWIASIPLDGRVGFNQRKQDSTYLRRSYDFELSYSVSQDFSVGLSFQQSAVYPSERTNNPVERSTSSVLGGLLWYDDRENPENPVGGVLYRTSYETGSKSVSKSGGSRITRVTLDLEYYISTLPRQVMALALHGRDIESNVMEQGDLIRIGGTSTLRGYRESQFLCSRVVWINAEYRFLSGPRSQVFGFLDGAYLALKDRPAAGLVGSEQSKVGYGVGARIESGVGIIGFSIGLGEGDTFRTAKLHLRLINEF